MIKKSKTIGICATGGIKKTKSPYVSETGVYKKVECKKCHTFFMPDDHEDICCYCKQDPMEEIDFINERKERMKMKKNGI
jgi:hypothetical protein